MRAQAAMEFVIMFMILLAALGITALVSFGKTNEINLAQTELEISKILTDVQTTLNTVWLEGPGFKMNLTIPQNIFGLDYSLQIESNTVLLDFSGTTYSKFLLTQNITGSLEKGLNRIENMDGEIVIAQGS